MKPEEINCTTMQDCTHCPDYAKCLQPQETQEDVMVIKRKNLKYHRRNKNKFVFCTYRERTHL